MKAREITPRIKAIYLAKAGEDIVWRFRNKEIRYAYLSASLCWMECPVRHNRFASLKADNWCEVKHKEISEIAYAYNHEERWDGFPENEDDNIWADDADE